MSTPITLQQLINASADATTLGDVINGAADADDVSARLGALIPTLRKAILRLGYEIPVAYVGGLYIDRPAQTVTYGGVLYAFSPEYLPLTTTNWATDDDKVYVIQGLTPASLETFLVASDTSSKIGHSDPVYAIPYLQTTSDILNGLPISVFRYIDPTKHSAIRSGTNNDDLAARFELAFLSAKTITAPAGVFNFETACAPTVNQPYSLRGEGFGSGVTGVQLIGRNDADMLKFVGAHSVTLEGMTLSAAADMATGIAVRIESTPAAPAFIGRQLVIGRTDAAFEWAKGLHIVDASEIRLSDSIIYGKTYVSPGHASNSDMVAISIIANAAIAAPHKFGRVGLYNLRKGISAINNVVAGTPGLEGIKIVDCDLVRNYIGVEYQSTTDFYPPQLYIGAGTHINFEEFGVYCNHVTQVTVESSLIYGYGGSASAAGITMKDTSNFTVVNNQMYSIESGNYIGLNVHGDVLAITEGVVSGNGVGMAVGSTKAAYLLQGDVQGVTVKDNKRSGSTTGPVVLDSSTKVNDIDRNFNSVSGAMDAAYVFPSITSSAGVINVKKVKFGGKALLNETGTTITGLTGTGGQEITLVIGGSITFTHGASLILKGGVNFVAVAGNTLDLFHDGFGWRESGRTA